VPLVFAGAWAMFGGGTGVVAVLLVAVEGPVASWFGLGVMMVLAVAVPCWFRGGVRNALMAFGSGVGFVMVLEVGAFVCFFFI